MAMRLKAAVAAPRLHVERGQANMEQGLPPGTAEGLAAQGLEIKDWPYGNLFFGGVHSVTLAPDGRPRGRRRSAPRRRRAGGGLRLRTLRRSGSALLFAERTMIADIPPGVVILVVT